MDKGKKISFIPQKPIAKEGPVARQSVSVFMIVSVAVFFLTFAAYAGLFFYKKSLEKKVAASIEELKQRKEEIDPNSIIDEARSLQKRIDEAKRMIEEHTASSAIFSFLESTTLTSITLTNFEITKDENSPASPASIPPAVPAEVSTSDNAAEALAAGKRFTVSVSGVAPSYASLAYQSDVFDEKVKSGDIEGYTISDISLDEFGNVTFRLEFIIDGTRIAYSNVYRERASTDVQDDGEDMSDSAVSVPDGFDEVIDGTDASPEGVSENIEAFGLFRF